MIKTLAFVILVLPGLSAYRHFQEQIPNGDRLPHPCKANFVWQGVGHMNKNGGGMRNRFGEDFARNGHVWDKCLCERDSDSDGKTNGEELGDPDCEWVPGALPKITTLSQISHPGICDPYDSEDCRSINDWDFCEEDEFQCNQLNEEGIRSVTLQFDKTKVPAQETSYMCQMFDLPSDGDYHVIATEPVIDNANVMHHTIVRMCTEEQASAFGGAYDTPAPCGMDLSPCDGVLPGWTVGMTGTCQQDNCGVRMGNVVGYTKVILQSHWNNPDLVTDYEDGSGLKFSYTPNLREYDINTMIIFPIDLNIPPKQRAHEEAGVCSRECIEKVFNGTSRYVTEVLPHMHYNGRAFVVEHWRGEERLPDLVNTDMYSYDSPVTYRHDPPVEIKPGDELKVICTFNSMNKEQRTYFGDGTQDEMCQAFMSVYPGPFFRCGGDQYNRNAICNNADEVVSGEVDGVGGCSFRDYFQSTLLQHYLSLSVVCDPLGLTCHPECEVALEEVNRHPCMGDEFRSLIRLQASLNKEVGVPFLHLLTSCQQYVEEEVAEGPVDGGSGELCAGGAEASSSSGLRGSITVPLLFIFAAAALW